MRLRDYDLSRNPVGAMLHRRQDQTSISRNLWDSLLQEPSVLAGCVQGGGNAGSGSAFSQGPSPRRAWLSVSCANGCPSTHDSMLLAAYLLRPSRVVRVAVPAVSPRPPSELGSRLPSSRAPELPSTENSPHRSFLKGRSFALRQGGCLATAELFRRQPPGAAARLPFKPQQVPGKAGPSAPGS